MGYVVYYRVSTKKQGESGLGLDAQKSEIERYMKLYAKGEDIVAEFSEVASGTTDMRLEFVKAINMCKQEGHTLLVSSVDRIGRKLSIVAKVIEDINVKVASMPFASNFELHIHASVAEQESKLISERTKAALQEAKARGVKLGGNNKKRRKTMEKTVYNKMVARDEEHRNLLIALRNAKQTYEQIAKRMNELGIKSPRGKEMTATTVHRMCVRLNIHIP